MTDVAAVFAKGRLRATFGAACMDALRLSLADSYLLITVIEIIVAETQRARYVALTPYERAPEGSKLVAEVRAVSPANARFARASGAHF